MAQSDEGDVTAVGKELLQRAITGTETVTDATAALIQASAQALALQFSPAQAAAKLAAIAADGLALTVGRGPAAAYLRGLAVDIDGAARSGAEH